MAARRKRKLTPEQKQYLIDLKKKPNEDDIRYKEIIKQKLLEDDILIWLLNNKELEDSDAENDEYFGINIRPEFIIPETVTSIGTNSFAGCSGLTEITIPGGVKYLPNCANFCCQGVCASFSLCNRLAILPISVFIPVAVTTAIPVP